MNNPVLTEAELQHITQAVLEARAKLIEAASGLLQFNVPDFEFVYPLSATNKRSNLHSYLTSLADIVIMMYNETIEHSDSDDE
jgi:hypothetical protein